MKHLLSSLAILAAPAAFAEDSRELGAHEHGVGALNIAVDGSTVLMEFMAPGADIVGFEYEATSDADKAAIEAGIATLSAPLDLFVLPAAAGCSVVRANAELETEDGDHDDHDHGDHDDHDHDDHAKDDDHHAGHDHDKEEDHAGHDHDDHDKEEDHAGHDHDDHGKDEDHAGHDHDDHAEEASHTEFHAEYILNCTDPAAMTEISFAYFETFENALELDVQVVTENGAQGFEVLRDDPVLSLSGLF